MKHSLFLLIAIYYIFYYPVITTTWNLNYTIGWHQRDGWTYLIPLWFVFVFAIYRVLAAKNIRIPNYLFWSHFLLSFLPALYFSQSLMNGLGNHYLESSLNRIFMVNLAFKAYSLIQVLFLIHLYRKLRNVVTLDNLDLRNGDQTP